MFWGMREESGVPGEKPPRRARGKHANSGTEPCTSALVVWPLDEELTLFLSLAVTDDGVSTTCWG